MAGGRPTKFTPEIRDKILQAVSVGVPFEVAASSAGITTQTLRNWMKKGEEDATGEFRELLLGVREAEGRALTKWMAIIDKAAQDGNWTAAAWKAERRYRLWRKCAPAALIATNPAAKMATARRGVKYSRSDRTPSMVAILASARPGVSACSAPESESLRGCGDCRVGCWRRSGGRVVISLRITLHPRPCPHRPLLPYRNLNPRHDRAPLPRPPKTRSSSLEWRAWDWTLSSEVPARRLRTLASALDLWGRAPRLAHLG